MIIGKVIGNVWATRKEEALRGLKFLVIQPLDRYEKTAGSTLVATDMIGAGIGETVLVVQGSSARRIQGKEDIPVDAAVVGIIDSVEVESE
ncbi:EutN/CcmL family microcompartment protein [Geosporobacter ferrireducens]|uniref:Ethanolamine utilization protein EutN n=1 Tax=Geosporobacter ferrireducens TaxID=1424294 RepID=A0A1D8GJ25_9FIRM|nr:EutN/CcmL family microcompartment protein [Geosporobacter ferrireducens]AOT70913.1 ethanolamine utilization protein EutN [Geosporobacter ferrireducens]MTI53619.1 ethanolamine utilization protein EutN [Geosporobacter ferrireducens]